MGDLDRKHSELDLCNRDNLRRFISDCLTKEEEKSRTQHRHPDLRDILPGLVDAITNFLFPKMPLPDNGLELPFYNEVNDIILNTIKHRGGTPNASNSWTGVLLNSIINS